MFSLFSFSLCEYFDCWMTNARQNTKQAKYWLLTIPDSTWNPPKDLYPGTVYLSGQQELGSSTSYKHWQVLVCFSQKKTLNQCKSYFTPQTHAEPSKSEAARDYVHKDESSVPGTRFELGEYPFRRNSKTDWKKVLKKAKEGALDEVPPDVTIRYYSTLKRISIDYGVPIMRGPQHVSLYWGETGTGKTRKFYDEIGDTKYYLKAPTTKWWDGYKGEEVVLVDEFRGMVEISHLLKWLDRYPCACEVKGAQVFLNTKRWVFTSNLPLKDWYKDLDSETVDALARRFTEVLHFRNLIRYDLT
jgi:hypothetical protein